MSSISVIRFITEDNVNEAYVKTQKSISKLSSKELFEIFKAVYDLVSNAKKHDRACKSSCTDIFNLANLCCSNVSFTEKLNRPSFMQCLYHITFYLLKQDEPILAKNLCDYFFKLKTDLSIKEWNKTEEHVLSNTMYNFINYLNENIQMLIDKNKKYNEESLKDWLIFIVELIKLNNFNKFSSCLTTMTNIFPKLWKSKTLEEYIEYGIDCINILTTCFDINKSKQEEKLLSGKNFTSWIYFVDIFLYYLNSNNIKDIGNHLLNIFNINDNLIDSKELKIINLLKKCLKVCLNFNDDENIDDNLKEIYNIVSNKIDCTEAILLAISLLVKFRNDILKNNLIEKHIIILIYEKLFLQCNEYTLTPRIVYEVVNMVIVTFHTVSSSKDNEFLSTVHIKVYSLFKQFTNLKHSNVDKNITSVVSSYVNVLLVYRKSALYKESWLLSKSLVKYLINLDSDVLKSKNFNSLIYYTLKTLAISYSERGFSCEAQIALVSFVIKHPTFARIVFKVWAELKVYDKSYNFNKESTCVDIITNNKDVIESEWISFSFDKLDFGSLLLHEVTSYTKQKFLHKEPVLAVYRQAANIVKDSFQLASILIATIECITTDGVCPYINNFEISLKNLLPILKGKNEFTNMQPEKGQVLCLLGNLYYQQVRCELLQLRKKCEDEVILLNVKPIKDIPILQGDQKDDLDVCNVTPAFNNLKPEYLEPIMIKMDLALKSWTEASELIINDIKTDSCLYYIKSLGYLYRLYDYKVKEKQVWELLYLISSKLNEVKFKVVAVAEILAITLDVDSKKIEEAIDILNKNETKDTPYIYQLFYVNLAKNLFNKGLIDESVSTLKKLDFQQVKYNFLVHAQLQVLFTLITCCKQDAFSENYEAPLFPMIKVYENLLYLWKTEKWVTFIELSILQWLLLHIAHLLGTIYADLKMVRYSRSYLKSQFTLAQRLCLPLRVCELLGSLSWSDIHCVDMVECESKLKGLETMLGLIVIQGEGYSLRHARSPRKDSPNLRYSFQCYPQFLSHESDCECVQCVHIDYQIQSLNYITLKALLLIANNLKEHVKLLFKIGDQIIKFITRKYEQPNYKSLIKTDFIQCKIRFLLAICRAHYIWNELDEAEIYNNLVFKELSTMNVPNISLEWCAIELKNVIKWQKFPPVEKKKPLVYVRKKSKTDDISVIKTPDNRGTPDIKPIGKIIVSNINDKNITPHHAFHKKFILPDDDDEDLENSMKKLNINDKLPIIDIDSSFCFSDEGQGNPDFYTPKPTRNLLNKNLLTVPKEKFGFNSNLKTPISTPKTLLHHTSVATTGKALKTYSRQRKVQTEKKKLKESADLFSTPSLKTFSTKSSVKVYCDNGEQLSTMKKSTRTTRRTTKKSIERKLFVDDDEKDSPIIKSNTKKKLGRLNFSDDSTDDDLDLAVPITTKNNKDFSVKKSNLKKNTKTPAKNNLKATSSNLNENNETKTTQDSVKIDSDVSILEITPPKRTTRRKFCVNLTPK